MKEMKSDWKEVSDNEIPSPEYEKELNHYDSLTVKDVIKLVTPEEEKGSLGYKTLMNTNIGKNSETHKIRENMESTVLGSSNMDNDVSKLYADTGLYCGNDSENNDDPERKKILSKRYEVDENLKNYIKRNKELNSKVNQKNKELSDKIDELYSEWGYNAIPIGKKDDAYRTLPSNRYHPELCNVMEEEGYSKEEIGMMDYLQSLKGIVLDKNNPEKDLENIKKSEEDTANALRENVRLNRPYLNRTTEKTINTIRKGAHKYINNQMSKIKYGKTTK